MTKLEFLDELLRELSRLGAVSVTDTEEYSAYYAEMIEDKIESGMSEEAAVAALGSPKKAAKDIMLELPFASVVAAKVKKKSAWRAWEIVFLILGSPIWITLIITLAALAISAYCVLWSLFLTAWAVDISLAAGGVGLLIPAVASLFGAEFFNALLYFGTALLSLGLSGILFFVCVKLAAPFVRVTVLFTGFIKRLIIGKGRER